MTKARKENLKKWAINLLKFSAPVLAILFFQLSQGVDWKSAGLLALFALYSAISDLFKKLG